MNAAVGRDRLAHRSIKKKQTQMSVEFVNPAGVEGKMIAPVPVKVEVEFAEAVERVLQRVRNGTASLATDSEIKKLTFDSQKLVYGNWDKPGPCQYADCGERSIRRSHTLQRAGPLAAIASADNHVIAPTLNYARAKIEYTRRGLDQASTFAGFCPEHERLFEGFENRGALQHPRDYVLQLYRTVSREAVRTTFDIAHHEKQAEKVCAQKAKTLTRLCLTEAAKLVSRYPVLRKYQLAPPGMSDELAEWMTVAATDLGQIRAMIGDLQLAIDAIDQGALGAHIHRYVLNARLPITLSGQSAVNFQLDDEPHRLVFFATVIPEATRTQILIASRSAHAALLDQHLSSLGLLGQGSGVNADALLGFVETFLFHGTDHWFFEEAYWKSLPSASRDALLAAVVGDGKLGVDPAPLQILPRSFRFVATRDPLLPTRPAREQRRAARRARGWSVHEPLDLQQSYRILTVRKDLQLMASRDNYSDDIHVHSKPRRKDGWVFTRSIRAGQWRGGWRRVRASRVDPFD